MQTVWTLDVLLVWMNRWLKVTWLVLFSSMNPGMAVAVLYLKVTLSRFWATEVMVRWSLAVNFAVFTFRAFVNTYVPDSKAKVICPVMLPAETSFSSESNAEKGWSAMIELPMTM